MKKSIWIVGIFMSLTLLSCGNAIDSDAAKVANLQCEAKELAQSAMSGDATAMEESKELLAKATKLTSELQKKYTSIEDQQKFQSALAKALGNCN